METHVYLHKNGGFPTIYKNCSPAFIGTDVLIFEETTGEKDIIAEYHQKDVFRVDVLMETE